MAFLLYCSAALSTLFRLATYLFLRVIPSPKLLQLLSTFYVLHLSSLIVLPASRTKTLDQVANGDTHKFRENGEAKHADAPKESNAFATLRAIVLSVPSPAKTLTLATVAVNTLLLAFAADMVFYSYIDDAKDVVFTRVGAVSPDSAKLVVRYPRANVTDTLVRVLWREVSRVEETTWNSGPTLNLTQERDWVSTVSLDGLWPSTKYEYVLGDAEGNILSYPLKPIQFHTFPDPRLSSGSHFRFVASSCATPNFPYLPAHGRRIKGFDLLADYLWPSSKKSGSTDGTEAFDKYLPANLEPPAEFMIFLGDFVYADVPFYYGNNLESYRRLYRRNYQSDSFRKVYERLPILHTYDDHEIINNYMGDENDDTPPFPNAADAFRLYASDANYNSVTSGHDYYDFRYADTAFFVMDTRRYRSDITKTEPASRSMLGDTQLHALYDWLSRVNETTTFKFIVSSVPFTSLWQHDAQKDSWAAYQYEKMALLDALHSVPNVILISGDRHEFASIKFSGEGASHSVLEVSTSPLSMFYVPFVRTLRQASENVVKVAKKAEQAVESAVQGDEKKKEDSPSSLEEEVPQEQVVKYIAEGNYKWSSFEVDTRDLEHPVVKLEVVIDGQPAYRLRIEGQPVRLSSSTAVANLVPSGLMDVLDKIGLNPGRWFQV